MTIKFRGSLQAPGSNGNTGQNYFDRSRGNSVECMPTAYRRS
nr:MAG TPA: hypothetical protein [Caudoviricetes sp.]